MKTKNFTYNIIFFMLFISSLISSQNDTIGIDENEWEAFPIINYDTDVGFGYGAKVFFYNFLESGESFDLTLYNSTKGERWYRLVYSVPDVQRRQGKKYDAAFDLIIDYDKWINYRYYNDLDPSIGTSDEDFEEYVREPIELSGLLSRAFTNDLIAEIGVRFKSISCYQFPKEGLLQHEKPSRIQHLSLLFNFRYDTRNNFINPKKGVLLELRNEYAKEVTGQKQDFLKTGLTIQSYMQVYSPELVFASRMILQSVTKDVTYQNKLSLGGNNSIRGLPQDRYLSKSSI
ncbi:MAG: BamA/TamA family outer membrane protein, partial [Melioribacteraceae bacterium]|nr:BamA/TamA family outer membrane protein [Melioribacteraceae bacterium]